MEMVQEYQNTGESRFFLVLNFQFDFYFGFDSTTKVCDIFQFGDQPYFTIDSHGLGKSQVFDAVIDHHFEIFHPNDLLPKVRHNAECQITVSNCISKCSFRFCPLRICMNPLMIVSSISEKVDLGLGDSEKFGSAKLLSIVLFKLFKTTDYCRVHCEIGLMDLVLNQLAEIIWEKQKANG
jgi:hypothetical protein